jgi:ech hydrogenase subunit D
MGEAHVQHRELPDIENVEVVEKQHLLPRVQQLAARGMRFITTTCIDNGEQFEVYYHFDHHLELTHLLVTIDKNEALPSITPVYFCAFVAENEMKDLFWVARGRAQRGLSGQDAGVRRGACASHAQERSI